MTEHVDREGLALPVHGIALVLGAGLLVLGFLAMFVDNSLHRAPNVIAYPIITSLLLLGSLTMWMAWMSFQRSRGAWSLLLAMFATLTLVAFFASPRLHKSFDLAWSVAMLPSLIFAVATVLLIALAPRYRH